MCARICAHILAIRGLYNSPMHIPLLTLACLFMPKLSFFSKNKGFRGTYVGLQMCVIDFIDSVVVFSVIRDLIHAKECSYFAKMLLLHWNRLTRLLYMWFPWLCVKLRKIKNGLINCIQHLCVRVSPTQKNCL